MGQEIPDCRGKNPDSWGKNSRLSGKKSRFSGKNNSRISGEKIPASRGKTSPFIFPENREFFSPRIVNFFFPCTHTRECEVVDIHQLTGYVSIVQMLQYHNFQKTSKIVKYTYFSEFPANYSNNIARSDQISLNLLKNLTKSAMLRIL